PIRKFHLLPGVEWLSWASGLSSANLPFPPAPSPLPSFLPHELHIPPKGRVAPSYSQRLQESSPDTRLCWRRNSPAKVRRE
ncbi:unnamed protein product, partial [Gulo gulo]